MSGESIELGKEEERGNKRKNYARPRKRQNKRALGRTKKGKRSGKGKPRKGEKKRGAGASRRNRFERPQILQSCGRLLLQAMMGTFATVQSRSRSLNWENRIWALVATEAR